MTKLRILAMASFADPDAISVPYLIYRHAEALAQIHDVTLVVGAPLEPNVRRAKGPFRAIEVVRMPTLERIHAWIFTNILKSNYDTQALTVVGYPLSQAFEWYAWRQLRRRIFAGEFDVVLRLLPNMAVIPSPLAFFLRKGPVPFVLGPLDGGLPWPPGFPQLENQKEWISGLRGLYRYLPLTRSTYRNAAAIIVGSSQTYAEFPRYRDKMFFVPLNAVSRSLCSADQRSPACGAKLQLLFVGGLVPRKACDLALRGAASVLRSGLAHFTVVGGGPEQNRLEQLAKSLGIEQAVSFWGWLKHAETLQHMRSADVLVFPSVRDYGGGVVFEALAAGAVPLVVDFGGPGDIVRPEVGYKVPMTNGDEIVAEIEKILTALAQDRELLGRLRQQGICYARESLTWEAKAQSTTQVLNWAVGRGPKPDFPPPKVLCASN